MKDTKDLAPPAKNAPPITLVRFVHAVTVPGRTLASVLASDGYTLSRGSSVVTIERDGAVTEVPLANVACILREPVREPPSNA